MHAQDTTPLVAESRDQLDLLAAFLRRLDPARYGAKAPELGLDSIGRHVRHVLDHYRTFLCALDRPVLDYDDRRRDTDVEVDLAAALDALRALRAGLAALPAEDRPLRVCHTPRIAGRDGPKATVESTLARELVFLVSHTVHHLALVAVLARRHGVRPAAAFGVAPATLRHHEAEASRPKVAAAR
jgi:uncharacterized damage-inducible protein DinB